MGLQGQLNDMSSDSIPFLLLAIVASCVAYVRSAVLGLGHRLGPIRESPINSGPMRALAEQLSLNGKLSYTSTVQEDDNCCVVCMSTISPGDRIRRLSCRHVFHKVCVDACIAHVSLNCPLCRSPFAAALPTAVGY